jgi:protein ImuA
MFAAEADDAVSAAGFTMAIATGMAGDRTILWLRSRRAAAMGGVLQANGWAELGGAPGQALFGVLPDAKALLRATIDALRSAALSAVVVESRGAMPELDLTASRRLVLAAEASGVPLFLLHAETTPMPSAATTRWQIAAAPSQPLPGNAPGHPTFDLDLLRQKSGPSGLNWRLEWDRDHRTFQETALCGAMVPVPVRRPAPHPAGAAFPRSARQAA